MRLGIVLRNQGGLATAPVLAACAGAAEAAGLDTVWVNDHLAIPPEEAEGSNGRYLDPLATLAYLAAVTTTVRLGTAVLILPYRRALPTAKWIASIQELSGGRLVVGAGVGWMAAEFRALGLERRHRGRDTDRVLDLLARCFAGDEVRENGQTFLFRPRPTRPPILIGGRPPHAFERAVRFGDGWLPVGQSAEELAPEIRELRERAESAGRGTLTVTAMAALPLGDSGAAREAIEAYRAAGVDELAHIGRYPDEAALRAAIERLGTLSRGTAH